MTEPANSPLPPALRAQCSIGSAQLQVKPPRSPQRDRILVAATRLFGERGYRGVTSDDLAAAANVSIGSIYTYFGDKRDCLLAAYDLLVSESRRRIARSVPPQASSTEQLDTVLAALVDEIAANPQAARLALLVVKTAGPEGAARDRETLSELAALLSRARRTESGPRLPAGFEDVAVAAAASLLAEALSGSRVPVPAAILPDLRALLSPPGTDASQRRLRSSDRLRSAAIPSAAR